jgi:glutaredoxin
MQKNKKTILIIVVAVLIAVLLFFYIKNNQWGTKQTQNGINAGEIILFYGQECPHCKDLEEWIKNNSIKEKISFTELEVYHNEENQKLIMEKARICNLDESSIGVPFLWTGETCLIGGEPIQQFFQNNINSQKNADENLQTNEANP